MTQVGSTDAMLAWLKDRYETLPGAETLAATREFDQFTRTTADLRAFTDQFEQQIVKLTRFGKKPRDEDLADLFIVKAALPEQVEQELQLSLFRLVQQTSRTEYTYEDVKAELLRIGKRPELFVQKRRVNVIASEQPADRGREWNRGSTARGREYASHDREVYYSDKGKGKGKGKRRTCFQWEQGNCQRGDSCWFAHGGKGPGRSPSRFRSSSRSPSQASHGLVQGARNECYDFKVGRCNRGNTCKFSHGGGRSPSRGRQFAGSPRGSARSPSRPQHSQGGGRDGRSRSPRFGKGGSPSRGAPSRSPRPQARAFSSPGKGACRLFQQGNCTYGASCRFTH
jgi:hypothetical protein